MTGPASALPSASDPTSPSSPPPALRGATVIADRVVAKIASQAAREALPPLAPDASPPHATVVVRERSARVRVAVELGYPCDIGARCGAVRRRVADRVEELAGMRVPEVAVEVERLHPMLDPSRHARTR